MNKLKTIVTPKGTLLFPHLVETEKYQGQDTGKYSVNIQFSSEDTEKMLSVLQDEWEAAKSQGEFAQRTYKRGSLPNLGWRENKDGDIIFKAKTNAIIKTKSGDIIERTVAVFDAKRNVMKVTQVGHGSIARLSVALNPYYTSSTNYGMSLYLNGIQILELHNPMQHDAASMGFGDEDGYVDDATEEEDISIPFPTDESDEF